MREGELALAFSYRVQIRRSDHRHALRSVRVRGSVPYERGQGREHAFPCKLDKELDRIPELLLSLGLHTGLCGKPML